MHFLSIFAFIIFQFNILADTSQIEGIVIVDSDLEELQQLRLNLLLTKKDELAKDGNLSEQDLIDFANLLDSESFGQTKNYAEKKLKRIDVKSIITKEDMITEYLEKPEFSHYLKFNYDLKVNNGNIILAVKYDLFDQTGKLVDIDDNMNFFRQVKKINKRAPTIRTQN